MAPRLKINVPKTLEEAQNEADKNDRKDGRRAVKQEKIIHEAITEWDEGRREGNKHRGK